MTKYAQEQAAAAAAIAQAGFAATFRSAGTASDPVTGASAADGPSRTVRAVKVQAAVKDFPETLIAQSMCTLLCADMVAPSDVWVDGTTDRAVLAVQTLSPDNTTHILSKVLISV